MHIYVTVSGITCMISLRARLKYKILFSSHLNSSDMIDIRLLLSLLWETLLCHRQGRDKKIMVGHTW